MVVSFEVTSNDLWTSWNSWLFQSNGSVSVIFRQRAQGKTEGGKQKGKKKDVPMEMEWVETCIPVEYCKLNNRHVWVRKGIGHCSVNGGVE